MVEHDSFSDHEENFLNHVAGVLIQIFPALMLQQCSTVRAENIDALSKRIALWEEGRLDDILNEAKFIQKGLKRRKIKSRSANKKNVEKIRLSRR